MLSRGNGLPGALPVRTSAELISFSSSASILKGRFYLPFVLMQPTEFCSVKTLVPNMFAVAMICYNTAQLAPPVAVWQPEA